MNYDRLVTGEMERIRYNGAASGTNVLVTYGRDDLGRRTLLARGNGTGTSYSYDSVSRLSAMTHDLGGTAIDQDLTLGFAYNPASQIVSVTRSNDAYAWTAHGNGTISTTADGLNRIASWNAPLGYDAKGNLTSDGANGFGYSSENLLTQISVPPWAPGTFGYDPLMRFATSGGQRFLRFQDETIAEYYNGALIQRFIPGEGTDETAGAFNGSGAFTWIYADERGSTLARAGASGTAGNIHSYDEYGRPTGNAPRIGFTGQLLVSFGQLYDYKNRFYHAGLGRFLQTDPIGYGDGMNMYAYVGNDPVNFVDPTGLNGCGASNDEEIQVCGKPDAPASGYPSLPRRNVSQVQPPSRARRVHRPTAARPQSGGPPVCTTVQARMQRGGLAVANVGAKVTKIGDGVALVGAGVAAVSAARLNPTGVLVGGQIVSYGTTLGVGGRLATAAGGSAAIAGGASVRQVGSQIIVDFLPASFLYRNTAERAVDGIMNYFNVPDKPRCVIK